MTGAFWPIFTLVIGVIVALGAACYWRYKHDTYVVCADNTIKRL